MADFHEVPFNHSYLHLMGFFKRDEWTCIQMAAKLRELFPEFHERITALFHDKNLKLSPSGFINNKDSATKQIDEQTNTHLQILKAAVEKYTSENNKELFQHDFAIFYEHLLSFLSKTVSTNALLQRDLAAQNWYRDLFADMSTAYHKIVVRCPETEMIESSFDWARIFNNSYRFGIEYYRDLTIEEGEFVNLIVPEATDNRFSLYDINELEHAILLLLSEPLSINVILTKIQVYFEEDEIQNQYETYEDIVLGFIKQLVIKKAIRPL